MEDFFTWREIVLTALNLLGATVVFLAALVVRLQFRHIAEEQCHQNERLRILEDLVSTLTGKSLVGTTELHGLSSTLESYFDSLKDRMDRYEKSVERNYDEIKGMMKRLQAT